MCALGTLWIKNCHCERKYGDPAGYCIMGPNGILCTRWEKEYASVRQTFVACDDCLVKSAVCAVGQDNTTAIAVVLSFDVF